MRVFNETGYERWTPEPITGSITAHEAKEFHTIVMPEDEPVVYQCHGNNVGPMGTLRRGDGGLTSGVPFVAVYNVQPVSTSFERNMLTAKSTKVAEALTAVGPQRRSDRGDMVITDARYWETRVARNGRGGQLDTVANCLKAEAGTTGIGDSSPMVLAYSVDKERGIPNSEGIKVQEMTVSSTITADGDPTERTDRGMRMVSPDSRGVGQVRRLTPTECERLQGFPDGWTIVDKQAVAAMKARFAQ